MSSHYGRISFVYGSYKIAFNSHSFLMPSHYGRIPYVYVSHKIAYVSHTTLNYFAYFGT